MAVTRSKRPSEGEEPAGQTATEETKEPELKKAKTETEERCKYHLFKSEGESRMQDGKEMKFSIDDLMNEEGGRTHWDGVRNFEARNCMQRMKVGDLAFFYHSNTKKSKPGIVGIVEVVKEAYPDHTAWDEKDVHYDAKSTKEDPKWFMVDVKLVRRFAGCLSLDDIKGKKELQNMQLVKRGRVSVQDVTEEEWKVVMQMAEGM